MRNVCWDLLRWSANLDIETRDEEAMVCPTVMCSRHGSYDMHVFSVSCSCKDIVEYVAHTMCNCLERGCFQVVFWPLRSWIRAFVTMRMCSAQTPSNSSPFALHFLMPLWPTIPFHRWWSLPTLALKSPSTTSQNLGHSKSCGWVGCRRRLQMV